MQAVALDIGTAEFHPSVPRWARRRYRRLLSAPHGNPLRRRLSAMAGFSESVAVKVLAHTFGKTALAFTENAAFLALCTAEVKSSSTNTNVEEKEATYTGYARKEVKGSQFTTTEAAKSLIKNNAELQFEPCTVGTSTITFWALCNKKKGEATTTVIMYGSCTSTVISTTQTPPVVANEKLVGELQ